MTEIDVKTKPEDIKPDEDKAKKEKQLSPVADPRDFSGLYGAESLPASLKIRKPSDNPYRIIGRMEIERAPGLSENLAENKKKKPFQPDAFDVDIRGVEDANNLKKGLNRGALTDAESRISERPPLSVFDRLIDIRDRIFRLRSKLVQAEVSGSVSETVTSTGTQSGNSKSANEIRSEIDSLKN